jgi:hypothetical protein
MMTPRISNLLFTSIVTLALACASNPAFGQHHGRGSRGGGGSHSGSSRGGGRSHGGGGRGFHSGGHNGGKSLRRGPSATTRRMSGGSYRQFGGLASRPNSNYAYAGNRSAGLNGLRSTNGMAGRRLDTSVARGIAASAHAPITNFNSNRPPNATATSRSWSGQSQSSWANMPRSPSSFNSNRPPDATAASRSRSGQGQSSWASTPRLTSFFDTNYGLPNIGSSRFGNSAFGRSSLSKSNSRTRSSVPQFPSSRFGSARRFDTGTTSFNLETSFDGNEFSLAPNIFGLALEWGGFGLRGLSLLGSGLTGFGLQNLDLPGSGLGCFSLDAGLQSRPGGIGSALYPPENLTCPQ